MTNTSRLRRAKVNPKRSAYFFQNAIIYENYLKGVIENNVITSLALDPD